MAKEYFDDDEICGSKGITKSSEREDSPFNDGDTLKILFLEMLPNMPAKEYKEWQAKIAEDKKHKEELGLPFIEPVPDYKKFGIAWKYCVIGHKTNGRYEDVVHLDDNGHLYIPTYTCFGRINQSNPMEQFKKAYYEQKLGMTTGEFNHPGLGYLPAQAHEFFVEEDSNGEKVKIKLADCHNNPDMQAAYSDMLEKEKERRELWDNYILTYDLMEDEKAINSLNHRLSRKYLVCEYDYDQDKWRYMPIQKGMVIQVGKKKGKWLDVQSFVWVNNDTSGYFYFFSTEETMNGRMWVNPYINEDTIALADAVLNKDVKDDEMPF